MKNIYTVKVRHCVEETYRVAANSQEDALEEYAATGDMIERDEEGSSLELVSVKQPNAPKLNAYSVLVLYPAYSNSEGNETYYAHVMAEDRVMAALKGCIEASEAEGNAHIPAPHFIPLLVLAGHVEVECYGAEL